MPKNVISKGSSKTTYCGYIAIIGRPNVGKSTLLNRVLGQKVSIISKKPQTTRHKLLGIKTVGAYQFVYIDTPGLHENPKHKINYLMIKSAVSAINDVDMIIFMVNSRYWTDDDEAILQRLSKVKVPILVVINKIDRISDKKKLLPIIKSLSDKLNAANIQPKALIPISAKHGNGVSLLEKDLKTLLPASPHFFPEDQITDRSDRFLASELIREKLMRILGEEIPHSLTVEIEQYKLKGKILHISAVIWVERKGQKVIVIGEGGERLKKVGQEARIEMERAFETKVFLQLWVKIKRGWTDDARALRNLGYGD